MKKLSLFLTLTLLTLIGTSTLVKAESDLAESNLEDVPAVVNEETLQGDSVVIPSDDAIEEAAQTEENKVEVIGDEMVEGQLTGSEESAEVPEPVK